MSIPDPRDLAIGLFLGTISSREAIAWADACIMRIDEPPFWLIEISTSNGISNHELLKVLPATALAEAPTDAEFLGAMAVRLIDRREPLKQIVPLLMDRFCFCEWTEMTDVRSSVYLIDDELDWDPERATRTAIGFLASFLDGGRAQVEKIQCEQVMDASHPNAYQPTSNATH